MERVRVGTKKDTKVPKVAKMQIREERSGKKGSVYPERGTDGGWTCNHGG